MVIIVMILVKITTNLVKNTNDIDTFIVKIAVQENTISFRENV